MRQKIPIALLAMTVFIFIGYKLNSNKSSAIKIGITSWVSNNEFKRNIAAFKGAFAKAGYIKGKDIVFIERNPNADKKKQEEIIKEFLKKKVDLIFSLTTSGTKIAKRLAGKTPIVFSIVTYPVESGIIKSHKNSANNLVGTRNYISLESQLSNFLLFKNDTKSIGFVHRKDESNSTIQFKKLTEAAHKRGIKVIEISPNNLLELQGELDKNLGKIDSLYSACDTLIQSGGEDIVINFAKEHRIPDFTCNKSGVRKGSFVGSIADFGVIGSLSGTKAIKILKDKKPPSELETEWPKAGNLVLNMTTARNLGIVIDRDILAKAKEVFR